MMMTLMTMLMMLGQLCWWWWDWPAHATCKPPLGSSSWNKNFQVSTFSIVIVIIVAIIIVITIAIIIIIIIYMSITICHGQQHDINHFQTSSMSPPYIILKAWSKWKLSNCWSLLCVNFLCTCVLTGGQATSLRPWESITEFGRGGSGCKRGYSRHYGRLEI